MDSEQLHLTGMTCSGLRLGLVLALFSLVGFESATTIGKRVIPCKTTVPFWAVLPLQCAPTRKCSGFERYQAGS
jgi:hypothetical protein